jgi:hypothetical protein
MTAHVYETLASFGSAGVFEILERVRPAREVDRWRYWKIDVISFALAILMNRTCSYFRSEAANACDGNDPDAGGSLGRFHDSSHSSDPGLEQRRTGHFTPGKGASFLGLGKRGATKEVRGAARRAS